MSEVYSVLLQQLKLILDCFVWQITCLFFFCPQRTLSSLEIPLAVANGPSPSFSTSDPLSINKEKTNETFSGNQQNGRQRKKNHDPARDLSIQVLEKFSLVTRFARETTNQIFGENSDVFGSSEKRNRNQSTHVRPHNDAANDVMVTAEISVVPDPVEVTLPHINIAF